MEPVVCFCMCFHFQTMLRLVKKKRFKKTVFSFFLLENFFFCSSRSCEKRRNVDARGILMQLVELVGRRSSTCIRCHPNMIIDHHSLLFLLLFLCQRARVFVIDHFFLFIFIESLTHIDRVWLKTMRDRWSQRNEKLIITHKFTFTDNAGDDTWVFDGSLKRHDLRLFFAFSSSSVSMFTSLTKQNTKEKPNETNFFSILLEFLFVFSSISDLNERTNERTNLSISLFTNKRKTATCGFTMREKRRRKKI